jgi:large subunit ribosomal protein L19
MNLIIDEITREQLQPGRDNFKVGDGVRVYTRVREGDKERIQLFSGIVICRKGSGIHESFTVRRVTAGEGVERVFPVNSVNIDKIEVDRESVPMKARLYYLRDRIGKAANKVREKRILEKLGQPVVAAVAEEQK